MKDISQINLIALSELEAGNDIYAQHLLRLNVRSFESCMTLNNLGVYYFQYGMVLCTGKLISAKKVGLRYLLKASYHDKDWRNLASISTALLEEGNVPLAYRYLQELDNIYDNDFCLYNMAICLYRMAHYHDARCIFMELHHRNIADILCFEGGQHPLLISAYCYLNEGNYVECIRCIDGYRALCPKNDRADVFCLRCQCGLYSVALSEIQALIKEWYMSELIISFIAECSSKGFPLSAHILSLLDNSQRMLLEHLTNDEEQRTKIITDNAYVPPFIELSIFIK